MQTGTEIAAWAAKLENLESRMLEELQEQFEKEDNTVWEVFPESSQEVVEVKVVEEDGQGYQRGELKFLGGEVFQGRFSVDLKHRAGKLYKDARSSSCTEGTWVDGHLDGRAIKDNDYGGWEVAYFKYGLQHGYCLDLGPYVHFSSHGEKSENLRRFSLYRQGIVQGKSYRGMLGGGFMIGQMEGETISDREAVIVMPGHTTAVRGVVFQDQFVRGLWHHVEGIQCRQNGIPIPQLSSQPHSKEVERRERNMWTAPLLCEPWEHKRVQARESGIGGAGEGLFAKKALKQGELVALMNGARSPPSLHQEWSDYRIKLDGDTDLDIPESLRSLTAYCATLAHKANHSFTPNCRWGRIDHPRFGCIISLVALKNCFPGDEITVNYRLPLHYAPEWYKDCHRMHVEKDIGDKKRKGESTDIRQSTEEYAGGRIEKRWEEGEAEHVRGPG